jgi:hypothetical protein
VEILRTEYREAEREEKSREAEKVIASRWTFRFLLLAMAIWLNAVVLYSIVSELTVRVRTPVTDWLEKITHLVGM